MLTRDQLAALQDLEAAFAAQAAAIAALRAAFEAPSSPSPAPTGGRYGAPLTEEEKARLHKLLPSKHPPAPVVICICNHK